MAFRTLNGPEQLQLEPGRFIATRLEYRAWHTDLVTRRNGDPWDSPESVAAFVNHGRWCATCRWCDSGMLTRPGEAWGVAYCGECGARYGGGRVVFPAEADGIERILLERVRRDQQNWDARQTVAELRLENSHPEVVRV